MQGERFRCRAGALHAGRPSFFYARRTLYIPGERYTYQTSAFFAGSEVFFMPASVLDAERVHYMPDDRLLPGGRYLCWVSALHTGRAFYMPGGCYRSERAIFIPGEYFKYRSSGLHTGRAVYMPGGRFTYLTPSTTG